MSFTCHIKRGGLDFREEPIYELVEFIGYFRKFKKNLIFLSHIILQVLLVILKILLLSRHRK